MQATVHDWDPTTRGGSVLLDDGRRLTFAGDAVQVRSLRLGQRVRLLMSADRVLAVTIATLPFT